MEVNQFLSNLTNLEKTRNFNVFKNYSLQDFQSVLESFCLHEKPKDTIRISIVGTNGKGSVGHFLTQIGFRSNSFLNVGLYIQRPLPFYFLSKMKEFKSTGNTFRMNG